MDRSKKRFKIAGQGFSNIAFFKLCFVILVGKMMRISLRPKKDFLETFKEMRRSENVNSE